jgi:hypothetical protein
MAFKYRKDIRRRVSFERLSTNVDVDGMSQATRRQARVID